MRDVGDRSIGRSFVWMLVVRGALGSQVCETSIELEWIVRERGNVLGVVTRVAGRCLYFCGFFW